MTSRGELARRDEQISHDALEWRDARWDAPGPHGGPGRHGEQHAEAWCGAERENPNRGPLLWHVLERSGDEWEPRVELMWPSDG